MNVTDKFRCVGCGRRERRLNQQVMYKDSQLGLITSQTIYLCVFVHLIYLLWQMVVILLNRACKTHTKPTTSPTVSPETMPNASQSSQRWPP